MSTLIKTTEELKKYVSVNENIDINSILPYIKQAERKFIKKIIGKDLYEDYVANVPTDLIKLEVYQLLREASANLSWFLYLPLAELQVSDSGIAVINSDSSKAADWRQIRDLRRSFVDAGFNALDEAIKIMESNEENDFDAWKLTEYYTIFNEFFVAKTETFNAWFFINNNRRTFLALRHYLKQTHYQYFTAKLDVDTIKHIKLANTEKRKEVLHFLQASQVHYTIAKVAEMGIFDITSSGIYAKLEELPGYKAQTLDKDQLRSLYSNSITAGEQFYKTAITIIKDNLTDFPNFKIKKTSVFIKPKNTKSLTSF